VPGQVLTTGKEPPATGAGILMGALQKQTTSNDSLIKQALPLLAGLAMGAVSKKSNAGNLLDDQASDLFAGLTGGDGLDIGDVLNLAKKFFRTGRGSGNGPPRLFISRTQPGEVILFSPVFCPGS